MIVILIILSAIVFIGGLTAVLRSGEADGICDYDYKED